MPLTRLTESESFEPVTFKPLTVTLPSYVGSNKVRFVSLSLYSSGAPALSTTSVTSEYEFVRKFAILIVLKLLLFDEITRFLPSFSKCTSDILTFTKFLRSILRSSPFERLIISVPWVTPFVA